MDPPADALRQTHKAYHWQIVKRLLEQLHHRASGGKSGVHQQKNAPATAFGILLEQRG
jgi:hypothetical protein